jgi:hypothetical protein
MRRLTRFTPYEYSSSRQQSTHKVMVVMCRVLKPGPNTSLAYILFPFLKDTRQIGDALVPVPPAFQTGYCISICKSKCTDTRHCVVGRRIVSIRKATRDPDAEVSRTAYPKSLHVRRTRMDSAGPFKSAITRQLPRKYWFRS